MLKFELLETKDIDLATSLKKYLQDNHPQEAAQCEQACDELAKSRVKYFDALRTNADHSNLKAIFTDYFSRIRAVAKRFTFAADSTAGQNTGGFFSAILPVSSSNPEATKRFVNVTFKYYDLLDDGKRRWIESKNVYFEIAMVAINYANRLTRIAFDSYDKQSEQSISDVCALYKEAAAIFAWLAEQNEITALKTLTEGLSTQSLTAFSQIMVAQAQVLFPQRAFLKKTSQTITASLTAGSAQCFADAITTIRATTTCTAFFTQNNNPKRSLLAVLEFAEQYHRATANLWFGKVQFDSLEYGKEIAYLYCARINIDTTAKWDAACQEYAPILFQERNATRTNIHNRIVQAEKDNQTIYFAQIPQEVPLVAPKVLATVGDIKSIVDVINDPFSMLVDSSLREIIGTTQAQLDHMVTSITAGLKSLDDDAQRQLAEMGLPTALDIAENPPIVAPGTTTVDIPDDLWQKINHINTTGGIASLQRTLDRSKQGALYLKQKTAELRKQLNTEKTADEQMRQRFGAKWTRQNSDQLTKTMLLTCDSIDELTDNASNADKTLHAEFERLKQHIQPLLNRSRAEIAAMLPKPSAAPAVVPPHEHPGAKPHIKQLREVVNELYKLFHERQQRAVQARQYVTDLMSKFRNTIGTRADRDVAVKEICDQLHQHLLPLHGEPQQQQQKDILTRIAVANRTFVIQQQQATGAGGANGGNTAQNVEMQRALQNFYQQCADFDRLSKNITDGDNLYKEVVNGTLTPLQQKVTDYCMAREVEAKMWSDDLSRQQQQQQHHAPPPQQQQQQHHYPTQPAAAPAYGAYPAQPSAAPAPTGYPAAPTGYPAQPAVQQYPQASYGAVPSYPQAYGAPAAAPAYPGYPPAATAAPAYPQQPAAYPGYPPAPNGYPQQPQGYPPAPGGYGYGYGR